MSETTTLRRRATSPQGEAWEALSRTQAAVAARLGEALAAAEYPPLAWYEVLEAIAEAPEQRMRMGDLAEALVISRGGLTKLIDRMVKAGLVERSVCDSDRRVSFATLCAAGEELLEEMRPVVTAELEAAFAARLDEREAKRLRDTLEALRASACRTS